MTDRPSSRLDQPSTDLADQRPNRRFWISAGMLLALLCTLSFVMNNGAVALVDEGLYSAQAAALAETGGWTTERPLVAVDPDGEHEPFLGSAVIGSNVVAYANHPLYPTLLAPLYRLGGYQALLLVSAVGTWMAALAAGLIAGHLDPRSRTATLWFTGVGTPLLFSSLVVMAHSIAAAAAGLLALATISAWKAAQEAGRRRFIAWSAIALTSSAALVMVRSEGALVIGGIAITGSALGIHFRARDFDLARIGLAIATGAVGMGAYFLDGRWATSITNGAVGASGSSGRITDPLAQAWTSLLRPWANDNRFASPSMALVAVLIVLAPLSYRLLPKRPSIPIALLVAAAVASLARQVESPDLVSGLLPAAPVVTIGLLLLQWQRAKETPFALLLGTSAIASIGVLWLSYGEGGGTEWGGRFFHVLLPLLTPVAVATLLDRSAHLNVALRVAGASALAILTASVSVVAVRSVADQRRMNLDVIDGIESVSRSVPTGTPVVLATINASGATRLMWSQVADGFPLLNGPNVTGLVTMLPELADEGYDQVLVISDATPQDFTRVRDVIEKRTGLQLGWTARDPRLVGDTGYVAFDLERT